MTHGEALRDPSTNLYKTDQRLTAERKARTARALALVEKEGITLTEAFQRIWK